MAVINWFIGNNVGMKLIIGIAVGVYLGMMAHTLTLMYLPAIIRSILKFIWG